MSAATMIPETTNVRVKASDPVAWFPWSKKATRLISKNNIPEFVNNDNIFQDDCLAGLHCIACAKQKVNQS